MYQSRDPTVCMNQQESGEEINTQNKELIILVYAFSAAPH